MKRGLRLRAETCSRRTRSGAKSLNLGKRAELCALAQAFENHDMWVVPTAARLWARRRLTRTCGRRDLQLPTNLAGEPVIDLAVARHYRACSLGTSPAGVVSALVNLTATLRAKVALKLAALHAAIVRCSASRSR